MFLFLQLVISAGAGGSSTSFVFKTPSETPDLKGSNWQPGEAITSKIISDETNPKIVLKVKKGPNNKFGCITQCRVWSGETIEEATVSLTIPKDDKCDRNCTCTCNCSCSTLTIDDIIVNKDANEKRKIIQEQIINKLKVKNNVMNYDDIQINNIYCEIKNCNNIKSCLGESCEIWETDCYSMRKPNAMGLNKPCQVEKIDKILMLMKYLEMDQIEIDLTKLNIKENKLYVLEICYNTFPFSPSHKRAYTPAFFVTGKTYKFVDTTTFSETIWFKLLLGTFLIGLLLLSILVGGVKTSNK